MSVVYENRCGQEIGVKEGVSKGIVWENKCLGKIRVDKENEILKVK